MKTLIVCIAFAVALPNYSQGVFTHDDSGQVVQMLKEFYIARNTVWINAGDIPVKRLKMKLDSLQQKYCSLKLRKELKLLFQKVGLDHDILINDLATEDISSLDTMSIVKDSSKKNGYIISYVAIETDMSQKKVQEYNTIYVTVVRDKAGKYRIDSVY